MNLPHLLSANQLTLEKLQGLFELAGKLETLREERKTTHLLDGYVLANLFFEPSTRTRLSFETAFKLLGGEVINVLEPDTSSLSKGESLYDMSRVVSGYADVLVIRHPSEAALMEMAQASMKSVINAGNGTGEHPTQALTDVYTMFKEICHQQFEKLQTLKICLVGDLKHGRTVHSLVKLLGLFEGIEWRFVSPTFLKMPDALTIPLHAAGKLIETENLEEGVRGADVVYMTRIQEERFASRTEFLSYAGAYSINKIFYEKYCESHALLMHPMPRDSRLSSPEIHSDLNEHPQLAMFRQSGNGVPLRMAVFCDLLGKSL